MLALEDLQKIIEKCREIGKSGLNNGAMGVIPDLEIDVLVPPHDFLGVDGNSAIYINEHTHKLLSSFHTNWIVDRTIALKLRFLDQSPMTVIGTIIHETGHAFNVAVGVENNEANAYIFEIEVLLKLLETDSPLLFGCSAQDVQSFFKTRLPYYDKKRTPDLENLVKQIKSQFDLEEKTVPLQLTETKYTLFSSKKSSGLTAHEMIMPKVGMAKL